MNVWVWLDHTYYDGLLTFAKGCADCDVKWMGEQLPLVEPNRNSAALVSIGEQP